MIFHINLKIVKSFSFPPPPQFNILYYNDIFVTLHFFGYFIFKKWKFNLKNATTVFGLFILDRSPFCVRLQIEFHVLLWLPLPNKASPRWSEILCPYWCHWRILSSDFSRMRISLLASRMYKHKLCCETMKRKIFASFFCKYLKEKKLPFGFKCLSKDIPNVVCLCISVFQEWSVSSFKGKHYWHKEHIECNFSHYCSLHCFFFPFSFVWVYLRESFVTTVCSLNQ